MTRYHLQAHFIEEQRKGFAVHHDCQKDFETETELAKHIGLFMMPYNGAYCYGLVIGVSEEPTLIDSV